jgi:multidrug efflux system membrane fusion protein
LEPFVSNKNLIALLIGIGMVVWLMSGTLSADKPVPGQAETEQAEAKALYKVRAVYSIAQQQVTSLDVSGQTEANRTATVRAEVPGRIEAMAAVKGEFVEAGDVLCKLAVDTRESDFIEASAAYKSAKLEHEGLLDLQARGLQSEINVAKAEAALARTQADKKRSELALQKTEIVAPFAGVIEQQPVEEGDYLNVGQTCVTVMEIDPILIRGQIAERSVNQVELGKSVDVQLITGETLQGEVTFIARSPESTTRTFAIEVTVPAPGPFIRAGISARLSVPMDSQLAHLISPAALVLNDAGQMGVRIVDVENKVHFKPVIVVSESTQGVWIQGLPDEVNLITVGQEEVFEGQEVAVDLTPVRSGSSIAMGS